LVDVSEDFVGWKRHLVVGELLLLGASEFFLIAMGVSLDNLDAEGHWRPLVDFVDRNT